MESVCNIAILHYWTSRSPCCVLLALSWNTNENPSTDKLSRAINYSTHQQLPSPRFPIGKGIAGHVAETGETLNVADVYMDERFNPGIDEQTGYNRNLAMM